MWELRALPKEDVKATQKMGNGVPVVQRRGGGLLSR